MKNPQPSRLAVILPSPLKEYVAKGEVKPRHYNPENVFDEVHFISFCDEDDAGEEVQYMVGQARFSVHTVGRLNLLRLPFLLSRVGKLLKSLRPQAVRAYDPFVGGLLAVTGGRAVAIPSVISIHSDFERIRRVERSLRFRLGRFLERYTLSRASRVICVTRALAPYAQRFGAGSVEVIYNRVYCEQFGEAVRRREGSPRRILSVGRLVPNKDHACILRAIEGLDVDLTIIGDGPLRPSLEALAARLGMAGRVRFIPSVPHREIQRYYAEADLFAIATRYEGFCIPVLEAMAAGLPVVASDLPPIREILGGAGHLVPHAPEAFRQALLTLINDPAEYGRCRRDGLKRAAELDGLEMERQEAAFYRQLLGADDGHHGEHASQPLTSKKPLWSDTPQAQALERGRARHLHRVRSAFLVDQARVLREEARRPLRVLDLGCGDGVITKLLRQALPHDDWIAGLDFDGQRLRRASSACPDVPLLAGDAAALPVGADSFDCIVAHHVIEHVPNDEGFLRECYRALRPGGICLVGIPQEDSAIGRVLRKCHPRLYRESEHLRFYSEASMQALLEATGFCVDGVAPFGFLFPNYYIPYLLMGVRPAFAVGHWLAQKNHALADSLTFVARKPEPR